MNFLHEVVPLLTPFVPLAVALVWPVTVLIILWWFKDRLRELIKNTAEAKVGEKLYFKFWQAKSDLASAEPVPTALPETATIPAQLRAPTTGARWDRVANIFWLGADLNWTIQTALRGAPKERIIHGLTQASVHATRCGLSDTAPGQSLAALLTQVGSMQEADLDRQWRTNFELQVSSVMKGFSDLAREQQTDFP